MSDDSVDNMPNPKIIVALVNEGQRVDAERKEIGMEYADRLNHHKANSNLQKWTIPILKKLDKLSEHERNDALRHLQFGIDAMTEHKWEKNSHVGDLVEQAEAEPLIPAEPAPTDAMPLDQAEKAFEATAHLAPTPDQVDELAAARAAKRQQKPKPADPDDDDDLDVRPRHLKEAEKQREAEAADEDPAPAPARRKKGREDGGPVGSYKLLN